MNPTFEAGSFFYFFFQPYTSKDKEEAVTQPTTPSLQRSHNSTARVTVMGKWVYTKRCLLDLLLLPCSTSIKSRVHFFLETDKQHPPAIEMRKRSINLGSQN